MVGFSDRYLRTPTQTNGYASHSLSSHTHSDSVVFAESTQRTESFPHMKNAAMAESTGMSLSKEEQEISNATESSLSFIVDHAKRRLRGLNDLEMQGSDAHNLTTDFIDKIVNIQTVFSNATTWDKSDWAKHHEDIHATISQFAQFCTEYKTVMHTKSGYSEKARLKAQKRRQPSTRVSGNAATFNPASQIQTIRQGYAERIIEEGGNPHKASPGSSVRSKHNWDETIAECPEIADDEEAKRLCEVYSSMPQSSTR